jgi:hypothetical protein
MASAKAGDPYDLAKQQISRPDRGIVGDHEPDDGATGREAQDASATAVFVDGAFYGIFSNPPEVPIGQDSFKSQPGFMMRRLPEGILADGSQGAKE